MKPRGLAPRRSQQGKAREVIRLGLPHARGCGSQLRFRPLNVRPAFQQIRGKAGRYIGRHQENGRCFRQLGIEGARLLSCQYGEPMQGSCDIAL